MPQSLFQVMYQQPNIAPIPLAGAGLGQTSANALRNILAYARTTAPRGGGGKSAAAPQYAMLYHPQKGWIPYPVQTKGSTLQKYELNAAKSQIATDFVNSDEISSMVAGLPELDAASQKKRLDEVKEYIRNKSKPLDGSDQIEYALQNRFGQEEQRIRDLQKAIRDEGFLSTTFDRLRMGAEGVTAAIKSIGASPEERLKIAEDAERNRQAIREANPYLNDQRKREMQGQGFMERSDGHMLRNIFNEAAEMFPSLAGIMGGGKIGSWAGRAIGGLGGRIVGSALGGAALGGRLGPAGALIGGIAGSIAGAFAPATLVEGQAYVDQVTNDPRLTPEQKKTAIEEGLTQAQLVGGATDVATLNFMRGARTFRNLAKGQTFKQAFNTAGNATKVHVGESVAGRYMRNLPGSMLNTSIEMPLLTAAAQANRNAALGSALPELNQSLFANVGDAAGMGLAMAGPFALMRAAPSGYAPTPAARGKQQNPPATGGVPPISGGTPPVSGGTPPVSGGTPPVSGTPSAGGVPPVSGGNPPVSGTPSAGGVPPVSGGNPPASGGVPPAVSSPHNIAGRPTPAQFNLKAASGQYTPTLSQKAFKGGMYKKFVNSLLSWDNTNNNHHIQNVIDKINARFERYNNIDDLSDTKALAIQDIADEIESAVNNGLITKDEASIIAKQFDNAEQLEMNNAAIKLLQDKDAANGTGSPATPPVGQDGQVGEDGVNPADSTSDSGMAANPEGAIEPPAGQNAQVNPTDNSTPQGRGVSGEPPSDDGTPSTPAPTSEPTGSDQQSSRPNGRPDTQDAAEAGAEGSNSQRSDAPEDAGYAGGGTPPEGAGQQGRPVRSDVAQKAVTDFVVLRHSETADNLKTWAEKYKGVIDNATDGRKLNDWELMPEDYAEIAEALDKGKDASGLGHLTDEEFADVKSAFVNKLMREARNEAGIPAREYIYKGSKPKAEGTLEGVIDNFKQYNQNFWFGDTLEGQVPTDILNSYSIDGFVNNAPTNAEAKSFISQTAKSGVDNIVTGVGYDAERGRNIQTIQREYSNDKNSVNARYYGDDTAYAIVMPSGDNLIVNKKMLDDYGVVVPNDIMHSVENFVKDRWNYEKDFSVARDSIDPSTPIC